MSWSFGQELWSKFKQRFRLYMVRNPMKVKLPCCRAARERRDCIEIFKTFKSFNDETYDSVFQRLDSYFEPKENRALERNFLTVLKNITNLLTLS